MGRIMTVTRTNIVEDPGARDRFIEGVLGLKREIVSAEQNISVYDAFVIWHHRTMYTFTPPGQTDRNAAHRGPVFLPWHRLMLIALEQQIQRVLGDATFGLPYWAWNQDGDLPVGQQARASVWADDCMGGSGNPGQGDRVETGPFAYREDDPASWRVRVLPTPSGRLGLVDAALRRSLARDVPDLPTTAQARAAIELGTYDEADWETVSADTFRNVCEGWTPEPPGLHNRVHVWVGGDMGPSTSPNDPVFFLNHANVDRMWAAWQRRHPGAGYLPGLDGAPDLQGHRLGDELISIYPGAAPTIEAMLDVSDVYEYDTIEDFVSVDV
jgi:tyrosinase